MAIDLLNRITKQLHTVQNGSNTKDSKRVSDANAAKVLRDVYSLKPGDSLRGELLSVKGNDISLLLGNAVTLNAKMDKNLLLQTGQLMNFIVSSNQNGKLSLQPLYTNTGLEQNAMKALEAANIPVTDKSLALAEEMMKEGLPLNKESLQLLFRQTGMYPDAEITDLVMLKKMNLPITKDNVAMMHLYQSNQQCLFEDLQGFSTQLSDFALEVLQSGDENQVQGFLKDFLSVFQSGDGGENAVVSGEGNNLPNAVMAEAEMMENITESLKGTETTAAGEKLIHQTVNQDGELEQSLNQELKLYENGNENPAEIDKLLKELQRLIHKKGSGSENLKTELSGTLFELLKEHFLMKPEEISNPDYVKNFYEDLQHKMDQLEHALRAAGKEETSLAKNVSTVKSNIQFMNQINELYHYVQLPLKMNQEAASGDLYVYKRKHAKTGDDGKLTALLHLSMPNLGNMDVFLSLQEEKLSTRFCMEDESLIDFMESNMHLLDERLIKKGYHISSTVTGTEKDDQTVIEQIMKNETKIPISSDTSFDARC